ncbi:MAG TPA: cation:proton antiporter [Conexibacter sp.]|nr:cation:proton antiporter [Conexibacter sp.]
MSPIETLPFAASTAAFDDAVLVLGGLLVLGALLSGITRRSFLAMAPIFVLVGLVLGEGGFDVLDFRARSGFVADLASVALIVILFRDGLEVEGEMLQRHWAWPARKLVVAMPITAAIVALAAHLLLGLDWTYSFLLGALLSPTDPVLSSSVVTNPRVPQMVRHSLNLESGLNDGLALAPVLALGAALATTSGDFVWWRFVVQDVGLGFAFGAAMGLLASLLLPRGEYTEERMPAHQRALYALGVAFATYGVTVLPPHGNGYIAVFVCAIVLGIRRPDVRDYFAQRSEDIVEIVKLGIFVVFGSLLTLGHLFTDGWSAVALVAVTLLLARPVAVFTALAGLRVDWATKAFMSWFGPKGVATMTFSLLILSQPISGNERIFDLAALVVVCSIIAHGLTDTPGTEWFARRSEKRSS